MCGHLLLVRILRQDFSLVKTVKLTTNADPEEL